MIRRVFVGSLVVAAALTLATATKVARSLAPMDAGAMFGIGIALAVLAVIVGLGFPDTRGRGL